MLEVFAKSARATVERAQEEARALGSPSVEAEHLLLALTCAPAVGPALAAAGLDHDAIVAALELELSTALDAVGVSVADFGPPAPVPVAGRPRFGTSAKAALEGALKVAVARGEKRLQPGHVGLALLQPAHGTVPRALALVGADVTGLRDRLAATL